MWRDSLWPPLAGIVVFVGLAGALNAYGVVGLLLAVTILAPFAVVTWWGLSDELGIDRSSAVRRGLETALGVLVLLGLCELFPRYGLVIAALVALTSPASLGLLARVRRGQRRHSAAAELVDPEVLDRRFHDIVSRLGREGDPPGV
jgi:hypothetical protein